MRGLILSALAFVALCGEASAERWLRIDPNDPFGKDGVFHWFDVDSAFEDTASGLVYSWGAYKKPEDIQAGSVRNRFLWAFDCAGQKVFFVGQEDAGGALKQSEGWRDKGEDLSKPHMGGVTNQWSAKLCALKGSLPKRPIG